MYYVDLPFYAQVIWIIFGLLVLLPWVAIPAIAIFKMFQVLRMPRVSTANGDVAMSPLAGKLGLTMADGGEKVEEKN